MRPKLRSRMPLHTWCVMLKRPVRLVLITSLPLLRRHLVEHGIAGDAGIVDEDLDRAEIGLDLGNTLAAGIIVGHVPFVDRDAGIHLEMPCAASSLPA